MMPNYEGVIFDASAPKPIVESYFLKANDPKRARAIWVRGTIFASAKDPSAAIAEAWAIAFSDDRPPVAVKQQVPFSRARFSKDGVDVTVGNDLLRMTNEISRGGIRTGDRKISWDLSIGGRRENLVHLPARWMYEGKLPAQKYVSPRLDARVSGSVVVGDETWSVESWPALLGHNWGSKNTPVYAWVHCNAWDGDEEVVFEAMSGKTAIGPFKTPKMLSSFYVRHRGARYDLNGAAVTFGSRSDLLIHEDPKKWTFSAHNALAKIEGEVTCETKRFVGLYYANPAGPITYCLNSKLATIRLSLALSGRAPFEVRSTRAAFEIGTQDANHGVKMYV
ncbi:MAG: hypothetical protein ABI461_00740 [Polyangiaceae bacterium]